jgi:pimeloyl-ACP methyl ester carboxylesterase
MVAPGGWRLNDHWEKGDALKALHEGKWDFVVLQEQSTLGVNYYVEGKPRIAGDQVFRPYAEKWAAEVRRVGAAPMFYLTWARKASPEDQAALSYAYMSAAKENGALVAQKADLQQALGVAWASSAVDSVSKWKSPVLFIHGDDDRNVLFHQTVDLVQRLDAIGVHYEELILHDEIHGFLRHQSWIVANRAMAAFFDRVFGLADRR